MNNIERLSRNQQQEKGKKSLTNSRRHPASLLNRLKKRKPQWSTILHIPDGLGFLIFDNTKCF